MARLFALLLIATAGADVAFDAGCDPLTENRGSVDIAARSDAGSERCAMDCVPDCFCCTLAVSAAHVPSLTGLPVAERMPDPAPPNTPSGVHPATYHPPLDLA